MNNDGAANKTIIFLHIVKTAGTTLNQILEREYSNIYSFYIRKESGELLEDFKQSLATNHYDLIRGHFQFGCHRYLQNPFEYFTIIREPVDRVISEYYYILGKTDHPYYANVALGNIGLDGFVQNFLVPNLQTRKVSGIPSIRNVAEPDPQTESNMLDVAIENLNTYFPAIGLTDRFDESLILFKRIFGWDWPLYTKRNVTKRRPHIDRIPDSTLELIQKRNSLDKELYEHAVNLFDRKIAAEGKSFVLDCEKFKRLNRRARLRQRFSKIIKRKSIRIKRNSVFNERLIKPIKGFDTVEGPYPSSNLPQVMWALGKTSILHVPSLTKQKVEMTLHVLNSIPDQSVCIYIKKGLAYRKIETIALPSNYAAKVFYITTFTLQLRPGNNSVKLKYSRYANVKHRRLSLLFSKIELNPMVE